MHKRIFAAAAVATAAATLSAPAPASADTDPAAPEKITIDVVTVNGSGCPAGTADVWTMPGNAGFYVSYSDYLAQAGGGSSAVDMRKNCQINLAIHVPQGFTYAIASAQYRGFASLQPGATGVERANYYFQGSPDNSVSTHTIRGSYSGDWQFTDSAGGPIYKPCGETRNLNINTEIRVERGSSDPAKTSFMAMDSSRGGIQTLYHFSWKQC